MQITVTLRVGKYILTRHQSTVSRTALQIQGTVYAFLSGELLEGKRATTVIPFVFIEEKGLLSSGKD